MAEYVLYKGYYIGHGPNDFHSRAEIDNFIKRREVELYKRYLRSFERDGSMGAFAVVSEQADRLCKVYGMTRDEVEALEIEVFNEN